MNENGQSHLVFAAGSLLGILTIGLLGVNNVYQFSPVLKIAMFFLFSLGLALIGIGRDAPLDYSLYLLSFSSFIMVLYLALNVSSIDTTTHIGIAALGSILFLGTGYAIQQNTINLQKGDLRIAMVVILFALILISAYDMSGPQPRYTFLPLDHPELNQTGGVEIGKITVHNRFTFLRTIEYPEYRACLYNSQNSLLQLPVDIENAQLIKGNDLQEFKASTTIDREQTENIEIEELKIVMASECRSKNASNQLRIVPVRK